MSWTVTERRYHGEPEGKFVVHWEDALRGPVETDDRAAAERIAATLNACDGQVEFTGMRIPPLWMGDERPGSPGSGSRAQPKRRDCMKDHETQETAASGGAEQTIVRIPVGKEIEDVSISDLRWIQRGFAALPGLLNKRQAQLVDACISFTILNANKRSRKGKKCE